MGNLQANTYSFQYQTNVGRWEWKVSVSLVSVPTYSVVDIKSPYGLLRDSIPIPSEVIAEMAAAIVSLRSSFPSSIVLGTPLTFVVDEGRGVSLPQTLTVTNGGTFGSLLAAAITSSAPYITTSPTSVVGLSPSVTGNVSVAVDSTLLVAGSYSGTLSFVDSNASNTPQTSAVGITVRPKATISVTPTPLSFTVVRPLSGPYPAIPTSTLTVQNTGPGGSVLDFRVAKLVGASDWLTGITPSTDVLAASATSAVVVTAAPPSSYLYGTYSEVLRISGYSTNSYVDVPVTLTIV